MADKGDGPREKGVWRSTEGERDVSLEPSLNGRTGGRGWCVVVGSGAGEAWTESLNKKRRKCWWTEKTINETIKRLADTGVDLVRRRCPAPNEAGPVSTYGARILSRVVCRHRVISALISNFRQDPRPIDNQKVFYV